MKKIFLVAMLVLISVGSAFASPAAINFDEVILEDEERKALVVDFLNSYDAVSYYEIDGEAKKQDELNKTKALYEHLKKIKKPTCDQELLELLTLRCLYNYDWVSAKDVVKKYEAITKKYKKNAEVHWIYANFLTYSTKQIDALDEFELYLELNDNMANEYFMKDYAYCQLVCGMPLSAYYTLTNGFTIDEKKIEAKGLLKLIKDNIKKSDYKKVYKPEEVWKISNFGENKAFIFSTMLGMSIPVTSKTILGKHTAFDKEEGAILVIAPEPLTMNKKKEQMTFIIYVYPKKLYKEDQVDISIDNFPVYESQEKTIGKIDYKVYLYGDGESKGYIYTCKVKPEKISGVAVEHPCRGEAKTENGVTYYTMNKSYERLDDTLSIAILVLPKDAKAFKAKDADAQKAIEEYLATWKIR